MILRLAKSVADTPAISEIAIMTPAIGDAARPMLDANCIGNIISTGVIPTLVAIDGTSGPNEKNEAFPLPIRIAARKRIRIMTIETKMPENPRLVHPSTNASIKPRLINPLEKISAATISAVSYTHLRAHET